MDKAQETIPLQKHKILVANRGEIAIRIARAAADMNLQEQTKEQLDLLATHLDAYAKNPASGDDALAIGRSL